MSALIMAWAKRKGDLQKVPWSGMEYELVEVALSYRLALKGGDEMVTETYHALLISVVDGLLEKAEKEIEND